MKTMATDELLDILDVARRRYGSLDNPNYSFVEREARNQERNSLTAAFEARGFRVNDGTDLNDDVCQTYLLESQARTLTVQLSFVGRFAIILESDGSIARDSDSLVQDAVAVLDEAASTRPYRLVSADLVRAPVVFRSESVPLYRLLFSDVEGVPLNVNQT